MLGLSSSTMASSKLRKLGCLGGLWISRRLPKDMEDWSFRGEDDLPMLISESGVLLLQDSRYDERTKDLAEEIRFLRPPNWQGNCVDALVNGPRLDITLLDRVFFTDMHGIRGWLGRCHSWLGSTMLMQRQGCLDPSFHQLDWQEDFEGNCPNWDE